MKKSGKILLLITMIMLCTYSVAMAKPVVGVLLSGYEDSTILRDGKSYIGTKKMKLYPDDLITAPNLEVIKIDWFPNASGQFEDNKLRVVYEKPRSSGGLFGFLRNFIRHLSANERPRGMQEWSSNRGADDADMILPGPDATLIPGELVNFAWGGAQGGQALVVVDSGRQMVFRKTLNGENWIDVVPEEMNLKAGETYTWKIEGLVMADQCKIRLLSEERLKMIKTDLAAMSGTSDLEKAAYLQFVSDSYSDEIDLYWLSYKYLKQAAQNNVKDDTFQKLWDRYQQHVKDIEKAE